MANCKQCGRKLPTFSFGDGECKWCKQYAAAQRGELPEDAPQEVMPAPWVRSDPSSMLVTQIIAGLCGAVFIAMVASGVSLTDPTSPDLIRWGANFTPATLGGQPWRLLTSVFVHIGVIHIALNMWCLWSLGKMAEGLYGRFTFAVIYLTCGIAGSAVSALTHPFGVSAGASGAIFGIAGALITSFKLGEFSMPRAAVQASLKSVVTFAAYNLIFGFISGRVDNSAHVGGLFMGLLLGALIAKVAPDKDDAGRRIAVLGAVVLFVVGGVSWYQYTNRHITHVRRASALMQQGKLDDGIAELQVALRLKPNYAPARTQLAYALLSKGNSQEAAVEMEKAVQTDPKDAYMRYMLGTVYQSQNQFDKARQEYLQATAISPQLGEPHFGLGTIAAQQGDDDLAIREFRKALQLDPEIEGAHYNLGLSLTKLKRPSEALAEFKEEIELSGDSADTEAALAEIYAAQGMKKEAEAAKQTAANLRAAAHSDGSSK